ncbi:uncharacterized protein LACBIDRAFT_297829 [Laccaria bicolor S238N-H82]|uniref:Predicted protein n=1 Tax=Laccaria bicolor (strain S238N-H82 / ATCC MYA-4686) TaxID=486041 RepID=B0DAZ9_LACBS|nr:uncharacterized protein LACBIDRAFT_297829 [Laccaria bicolor S238N-H82]EDR08119.1 predicted protein [Laccaria bicolor S238N-H82]|eukprot:XP_001881189.1 predicted protein [Laccaria bicolor S238N-H82]
MSSTELDHIADQLLVILDEMRSYKSTTLGAVTGGPYRNRNMPYPWQPPHAFSNVKDHFPTDGQVHFTHGDLLPHNILVDGSKITAIVDWETAGYYPDFWEYCWMHDCGWMTPAWGRVLARMFPGPPREKEIDAVYQILRDLYYNSSGMQS